MPEEVPRPPGAQTRDSAALSPDDRAAGDQEEAVPGPEEGLPPLLPEALLLPGEGEREEKEDDGNVESSRAGSSVRLAETVRIHRRCWDRCISQRGKTGGRFSSWHK